MNPHFASLSPEVLRGLQLKELGRYAEAERAFREALGQTPRDAFLLHQLAGCLYQLDTRKAEALTTIEDAIAIEPEEAEHHVLRAFILCSLERLKEGAVAAERAIGFDPYSPLAFAAQAQAALQMERWADAEAAARQALALDGDLSIAANQLAHALRLQNRGEENARHLAGLLEREPEDPFTHANAGWAALQAGRQREAEQHFREALRLNPEFEYAREGLLSSFRARSAFYRGYLQYCFWMQRLSSVSRWAVIIGLYLMMRVMQEVFTGPYRWIGIAAVALYFVLVLWVWVAKAVGNFILLFDRFARYALRREEKLEALVVGGGVFGGLVLAGSGALFNWFFPVLLGIAMVAASFPLSLTFTNPSVLGSRIFGAAGAVMLLTGLATGLPFLPGDWVVKAYILGLVLCLASTWLGNIPALRRGSS